MNKLIPILIINMLFLHFSLNAQTKNIGECSLKYIITNPDRKDTLGVKYVYVKGDQCMTVLQHPQLTQTLLFNIQQPTAIITKDIGASHFLQEINYPPSGQSNLISMKEMVKDSSVQILGYPCKYLELKWSDGIVYQVWYTTEMVTTVNTFEIAFKEIAGLVLCYNIIPVTGDAIQYRATSIDFSPIPLSQFNINRAQYQIID